MAGKRYLLLRLLSVSATELCAVMSLHERHG